MQIAATPPWSQDKCQEISGIKKLAVFSAPLTSAPVIWLARLLQLAGDIEPNPGPPKVWICLLCSMQIKRTQSSILCKHNHWVHLKCSNTTIKGYRSVNQNWECQEHTKANKSGENNNSISRNTNNITQPKIWTCSLCTKQINRNQTSILCKNDHWVHLKCTSITLKNYKSLNNNWQCAKHAPKPQPPKTIKTKHKIKQKQTKGATPKKNPNKPKQPLGMKPKKIYQKETKEDKGKPKIHQRLGSKVKLKLIQINANGIRNKVIELEQLADEHKPDIIAVQESKLNQKQTPPEIHGYAVEKESRERMGGGVLTYIKDTIRFTRLKTIKQRDEAQLIRVKLHLQPKVTVTVSNLYITPKQLSNEDDDIIVRQYLLAAMEDNAIVLSDVNAHSRSWYENGETDHRGRTIEEIIDETESMIVNEDKPTRRPFNRGNNIAQDTAPDISIIPITLAMSTTWEIENKLSSDHLLIVITINTGTENKRKNITYTNYKKANWEKFTEYIEENIQQYTETEDVHKLNQMISEAIQEADRRYIPKGSIRAKTQPLPEHIRDLIQQRNNLRENDPNNIEIPNLNQHITNEIAKNKKQIWEEKTSDKNWSHGKNPQKYWALMRSLQGKSQKTSNNRTIKFKNKYATTNQQIANAFNKQYTSVAPKTTEPNKRKTARKIKNLETEPIEITVAEVRASLKAAPNKKSTGPDNISMLHLKHLGTTAIKLLAKLFTLVINKNVIPQIWKTAKIVPLPKPGKDKNEGKSYRPISLLSNIAKLLERIVLNRIKDHLPKKRYQHGYKKKHSTTTALQFITHVIASGFNKHRPPQRTITIAVDMSRAFDVVNHNKLIEKMLNLTTIPPIFIKFLANYIQGRRAYTIFNDAKSKQRPFHAGVPQGGVLSPALFNLFMANMPEPDPETGVYLVVYADDVTILVTHEKVKTAKTTAQANLDQVVQWIKDNGLILADKTQASLFTPDPAEYDLKLNLELEGEILDTVKNPTILGLTLDPKLTFNEHIKTTEQKGKKSTKLIKAITGTNWGQQKETVVNTYKQYTRPVLEYAAPAWAPIIRKTNINKLQVIQNTALRCATGHTKDTNIQHLHQETKVLPIETHTRMITSQYRESMRDVEHPLHETLSLPDPDREMKLTAVSPKYSLIVHGCDRENKTEEEIQRNKKIIHTALVQQTLSERPIHTLINRQAPDVHPTEKELTRFMRRTLAQLRAQKSPMLRSYLHNIGAAEDPSCPLCRQAEHNTHHIFNCLQLPTELTPEALWKQPLQAAGLVRRWEEALTEVDDD